MPSDRKEVNEKSKQQLMACDRYYSSTDAQKYGIACAVVLQNIRFWVNKNKANSTNIYDGRHWTYNTINAFCKILPEFTTQQMRSCVKKLIDAKILLKSNHSESLKKGSDCS